MYPYGPQQNDADGTSDYWHCPEVRTDQIGFPFFGERHYKLYVGTPNYQIIHVCIVLTLFKK